MARGTIASPILPISPCDGIAHPLGLVVAKGPQLLDKPGRLPFRGQLDPFDESLSGLILVLQLHRFIDLGFNRPRITSSCDRR